MLLALHLAAYERRHAFILTWFPTVPRTTLPYLTGTRSRTHTTISQPPINNPYIYLYNHWISLHVQPDDGQHP